MMINDIIIILVLCTQSGPILCDSIDYSLPVSSVHGIFQNTQVGCHFPLWGKFPTHKLNLYLLCLLNCRQILYPLSHGVSPIIITEIVLTEGTLLVTQVVNCLPAMQETQVQSLGWGDPLEKEMVIHSCILAWKIPLTEESMGFQSQT